MKTIKFALRMRDGVEVRTLEELRTAFDMEKIIGYLGEGKLQKWLEDRHYDSELTAITGLDVEAPDAGKRICEIFQVDHKENAVDIAELKARQENLKKIVGLIESEDILNKVARALKQTDIAALEQYLANGMSAEELLEKELPKEFFQKYASAQEWIADQIRRNFDGDDIADILPLISDAMIRQYGEDYPYVVKAWEKFVRGEFNSVFARESSVLLQQEAITHANTSVAQKVEAATDSEEFDILDGLEKLFKSVNASRETTQSVSNIVSAYMRRTMLKTD